MCVCVCAQAVPAFAAGTTRRSRAPGLRSDNKAARQQKTRLPSLQTQTACTQSEAGRGRCGQELSTEPFSSHTKSLHDQRGSIVHSGKVSSGRSARDKKKARGRFGADL